MASWGSVCTLGFCVCVCVELELWTLRKKTPTKKDSRWLPGIKLKKQSPAGISVQGALLQTALQGEAHTELCLPAEPALQRSSWNPISTNWTETSLVQLELPSYIPITFFTDQSILTSQDSVFWASQIARIWSPHLHVDELIRDERWGLLLYKLAPPWLWEHTFPFHQKLKTVFPWLARRPQNTGAECHRLVQSRAIYRERARPQDCLAAGPPAAVPLRSCAVSQLSCLHWIVSFTAPQTGDSRWCWIDANDLWLTGDGSTLSVVHSRFTSFSEIWGCVIFVVLLNDQDTFREPCC